jgi:AraC-like DNA-binding protein
MLPDVMPHPDAERIAAEVAARYGVAVRPGAVVRAPRGASGRPLPVWDGKRLIAPDYDKARWSAAAKAEAVRKSRLARVDAAVVARRERVRALHAEGATVAEMIEGLQVHGATVRNDLVVLQLSANRPLAKDPAAGVRDLISRGFTRRADIAAELGWTENWLLRVAAKAGIALPEAPRVPKPRQVSRQIEAMKLARQGKAEARRETVARLQAEGADLAAIMAATGSPKSTVRRDLKILGLTMIRPVAGSRETGPTREDLAIARQAQVAQMVAGGLTRAAMRARLKVTADTLRRDLKVLGLTVAPPVRSGSKAALLAALRVSGRSRDDLCEVLGWSRSELSRRATKAGVKLPPARPEGYVPPEMAQRMATKAERMERTRVLHAQGAVYAQIAAALGISEGCVHGYLNELGLTRPRDGVGARRERVAALRREGMTATGICAETGFGMAVVCADLRVLGMGQGWRP